MEKAFENSKKCPYEKSGILAKLFFWWAFPLIKKGSKGELKHDSMFSVIKGESTNSLWKRLDRCWNEELKKTQYGKRPSLRRAIAKAYGKFYALSGIVYFIEDCMRLATPIMSIWLIEYFEESSNLSRGDAYLLAGGIALAGFIQGVAGANLVQMFHRAGMTWTTGTSSLVFRKIFRLSNTASAAPKSGHILDLVSNDAWKLEFMIWYLHVIWQAPLQTVVVLTFTYFQLGPSVFSSLGLVLIMLPLQSLIGKKIAKYREKNYEEMDRRVNLVGEIIGGMRVIKMYCWEKPFGALVHAVRKREIQFVWLTSLLSAVMSELDIFNNRFFTAVVILVYAWSGGIISAAKVFPMFSLFNVLSVSLMSQVPWGVKNWLDVGVSVKRLEDFLLLEENEQDDAKYVHKTTSSKHPAVMLTNVKCSWSLDDSFPTLSNISLSVKRGELLCVLGDVGSGKTSLLHAIGGELQPSEGSIFCVGNIAYSAQNPWIFSSSIRKNILFGKDFKEERYLKTISMCCLERDLALFPSGDQTLVGDKGVTLSGGQKARVSLARAVYADADVYLLDDPLSAVDTHVGRELFTNCIQTLAKDKLVILATHQLQYVKHADKILELHKGEMHNYGGYEEFAESLSSASKVPLNTQLQEHDDKKRREKTNSTAIYQDLQSEIRKEEDRAVGSISWSIYWKYFRAGAPVYVLLLIMVLNTVTQLVYNIGDWWLSVWTDSSTPHINSTTAQITDYSCNKSMPWDCLDKTTSAYIYIVLLALMYLFGLIRTSTLFRVLVKTSINLHNQMYTAVVRAPIRFHDTNTKGRIINRFSSDISSIDSTIPDQFREVFQYTFVVLGNTAVITYFNPVTAIAIIPVLLCVLGVRYYYLRTMRQVMRLQSAAESPVLSHISETIDGIHSIRMCQNQAKVYEKFEEHYDAKNGVILTHIGVFGWFQCNVHLLGAVFNAVTTFACLLILDYSIFEISPGQVGLILSYISSYVWNLETAVRLSTDVETEMVKAERVLRYTDIEPESSLESDDYKPPSWWPRDGRIVFDHVSFAHAPESPLVLKNIACTINENEKVGIVGRTGAGKSSLIQCLFRMAEPIGQIRIDDIPINDLGLHDSRSKMTIIPQDPILFGGSVRFNIDPFGEYGDQDIWLTLEQVMLKSKIQDKGLQTEVQEGGLNFSVGERQLFCLARALLRHNKILILDEATANVDMKTDDIIQHTIREKFRDCIVITVAHRLHTIMDNDRVMVLDNGKIVEFDTPYRLLQDRNGLLYNLTSQTGEEEQMRLYQMAEDAYVKSKTLVEL